MKSNISIHEIDLRSIEFDHNSDTGDYGDNLQAYATYALWANGEELTEAEIDTLNEADWIDEYLYERWFGG